MWLRQVVNPEAEAAAMHQHPVLPLCLSVGGEKKRKQQGVQFSFDGIYSNSL